MNVEYVFEFRDIKKDFTKIKIFPWSSTSNTSLSAEVNSGSAKRVHQDNSSDKHFQENRPTMGMFQLLFWYLITWLTNICIVLYIFLQCFHESLLLCTHHIYYCTWWVWLSLLQIRKLKTQNKKHAHPRSQRYFMMEPEPRTGSPNSIFCTLFVIHTASYCRRVCK